MTRPLALALACGLVLAAPAPGQEPALPGGADAFERTLVDLASRARERTVLVFGVIGLGSGAVVSHDGLIVTNAHVAAAARYAVVQWADGSTTLMRRRGIDYGRDLAVLEPDEPLGRAVPAFSIGPRPEAGQWVVALGFPGGLRGNDDATVSVGTVTGVAEEGAAAGVLDYAGAIQTDAPIFSGNSGGPLVDLEGRLVGINGAVDLERATSLTIPPDVVRDRLETLTRDVIVLPGGRRILPGELPFVDRLFDAIDPFARQLPRRVADAARAVREGEAPELPGLGASDDAWEPSPAAESLVALARESPRGQALEDTVAGPPAERVALVLGSELYATRIGPRHAVCKASALGDRTSLELPGGAGRAERVAVSEPDDLALVLLPEALRRDPPADAPHQPVGSLVHALGPDGVLASGIVSVRPRPTSAGVLAQIQQAGVPPLVERAIGALGGLAERFDLAPLRELLEQIERSIEMRQAFAAGTPPRSYPLVLSTDAPLAPGDVGVPLVDRAGRVIGVVVGVAHHGTSYVVPLFRLRRVFAAELDAPAVPERRGEARLY